MNRARLCMCIAGGWLMLALPSHAADARFDAFMGRVVGNGTTVGFGGGGTPIVTSSAGLGTPTIGNMGLSPSGSGVVLGGNAKVPLGGTGKAVEAVAKAPISRLAMMRGVATVLSGPAAGIALSVAAPLLYDWMKGRGVGINPDPKDYPDKPFLLERRGKFCEAVPKQPPMPAYTGAGWSYVWTFHSSGGGKCMWGYEYRNGNYSWANPYWSAVQESYETDSAIEMLPASLADISPYMDAPEAPALTPQIVEEAVKKAGIDPFGGEAAKVSVTGPASVPGQKTQTSTQTRVHPGTTTEVAPGATTETQPATRTQTSTTTHNVTYNDNRVNYTTTTVNTTTITNNVTGATTTNNDSTTDTEDDSEETDELATDTPLGEVPKLYERKYPDGMVGIWNAKKDAMLGTSLMTFLSSLMPTGFVAGTCPSWSLNVNFGGVMDMGTHPVEVPCWLWDVVKAALIVLALLYARGAIFGR